MDIESTQQAVANIVLHLHFENRKKKQIKFAFDFRNDTSTSVATEMCRALKLAQSDRVSSLIAHTIESKVEPFRKAYYDQMRAEPTHVSLSHSASAQPLASQPHSHSRHSLPAEHFPAPSSSGMSHSTSHGHLHHHSQSTSSSPLSHSHFPPNGLHAGQSSVSKRSTGPATGHSSSLYPYPQPHHSQAQPSPSHGIPGPTVHSRQHSLPSPHPGQNPHGPSHPTPPPLLSGPSPSLLLLPAAAPHQPRPHPPQQRPPRQNHRPLPCHLRLLLLLSAALLFAPSSRAAEDGLSR